MAHDDDLRYAAVQSRDARFDGWFFVGVTTTGIYCRPSCASVTPRRDRVRFFPSAAAAQGAGFRSCKRCRPDASPGSPEWNRRGDVVARAMRAIADGVIDREGVAGLAHRLGYSTRQLNRLLRAEVGAGPLELARAQRAQTARILLETTTLRLAEVAFAAGFGSVRQFNDTVRAVFADTPRAVRARQHPDRAEKASAPGTVAVSLRLAFRPPLAATQLFSFLAARAVDGIEVASGHGYSRTMALPRGTGVVSVRAPVSEERFCRATITLDDLRDLTAAVRRLRRLLDLDADPAAVSDVLSRSTLLAPAVRSIQGLRIPGHVDGTELAVRAVIGQQVSVAGARSLAGRLVESFGGAISSPTCGPNRLFPSAELLAGLPPQALPMPAARAEALVRLCRAIAEGDILLEEGVDRDDVSARLLALPGIGPWTVAYVRMRALADPDAFMAADLGVRRALESLGLPGDPAAACAAAEAWRPYRAYGLQYLWAASDSPARSRAPAGERHESVREKEEALT